MTSGDRKLRRELLWVVLLKLVVLYGLWSLFIAPQHVTVSPEAVADAWMPSDNARQTGENHAR